MRYCTRCVLPDTRPNLRLDAEGICNACRTHEARALVDWDERRRDFEHVVGHARSRGRRYDCLVPVSGGKDSTWQVVTCLEHGLTPLAVTWKTPARTELGRRNLENLISLGVDHVDYQVSPAAERVFMRLALERYGDTGIPMHMALFAIPLTLAVRLGIPLVVWGENSAVEYGSPDERLHGARLDGAWLERFGRTHGTTARDWASDELSERALAAYFAPSADELERAGVNAVFLGHYFAWDPARSLEVALAHGFEVDPEGPRVGTYDYADVDDEFISVHHYPKWLKFGFTRSFDTLSLEIRNGRLTRDEAIETLRRLGDETPHRDIESLCRFVGITTERFSEALERFRNREIWTRRNGTWVIEGFLIPDWTWEA